MTIQPERLSLDEARLLPRMRAAGAFVERGRMLRLQAEALRDAGSENPPQKPVRAQSSPGDLRGIPVIGQGVGGVSPGTSPESAIDRVHREREKRRRVVIDDGPSEPMVAYA